MYNYFVIGFWIEIPWALNIKKKRSDGKPVNGVHDVEKLKSAKQTGIAETFDEVLEYMDDSKVLLFLNLWHFQETRYNQINTLEYFLTSEFTYESNYFQTGNSSKDCF